MQAIQEGFQITVDGRKGGGEEENSPNINRNTNISTIIIIDKQKIRSCRESNIILLYKDSLQDNTGRKEHTSKDMCVSKAWTLDVYVPWTGNEETIRAADYLHRLN